MIDACIFAWLSPTHRHGDEPGHSCEPGKEPVRAESLVEGFQLWN
jgi:hypothetical protein